MIDVFAGQGAGKILACGESRALDRPATVALRPFAGLGCIKARARRVRFVCHAAPYLTCTLTRAWRRSSMLQERICCGAGMWFRMTATMPLL